MIVLVDANRLWCIKPFQEMCVSESVIGVQPFSLFSRASGLFESEVGFPCKRVRLLPGWATRFTGVSASMILRSLDRDLIKSPATWVFTSPHYVELNRRVAEHNSTIYYCSDDFTEYAGWDPDWIKEEEHKLVLEVDHSCFVSNALLHRARDWYNLDDTNSSMVENATDERFFFPNSVNQEGLELKPPVVGVVGMVNDRLDAKLLVSVSRLREVGTLLFVGGEDEQRMAAPEWKTLKESDNCVFLGKQPHSKIPGWMDLLDVALIPYAETQLNYYCSPMRLFDHLAVGKPIVATAHCHQIRDYAKSIFIGSDKSEFLNHIVELIQNKSGKRAPPQKDSILWRDRSDRILSIVSQL